MTTTARRDRRTVPYDVYERDLAAAARGPTGNPYVPVATIRNAYGELFVWNYRTKSWEKVVD